MPSDIIHTIGVTAYSLFLLLFLWAWRVPKAIPGAGWWALGMLLVLASRLTFLLGGSDAEVGLASAPYAALNVAEKGCLLAGLIRFFDAAPSLHRLVIALALIEVWIASSVLLGVSLPVRSGGIALFSAGSQACAAWIVWRGRDRVDRRLMSALAAVTGLLALHWMSALLVVDAASSWWRNGFLLGTALVLAQYLCLLAIIVASFQQRLVAAEARALALAFEDSLTGLSNRRHLELLFQRALQLANRADQCMALVYIDIDNFKPLNDRGGHQLGDLALQALAARLRQVVRSTDICARIGGDEFAILCTQLDRPAQADDIGRKLLAALRKPLELRGGHYALGASIGISLYPRDGATLQALMERADLAMYEVKQQGRDGYRIHPAQPQPG